MTQDQARKTPPANRSGFHIVGLAWFNTKVAEYTEKTASKLPKRCKKDVISKDNILVNSDLIVKRERNVRG